MQKLFAALCKRNETGAAVADDVQRRIEYILLPADVKAKKVLSSGEEEADLHDEGLTDAHADELVGLLRTTKSKKIDLSCARPPALVTAAPPPPHARPPSPATPPHHPRPNCARC